MKDILHQLHLLALHSCQFLPEEALHLNQERKAQLILENRSESQVNQIQQLFLEYSSIHSEY